MKHPSNLMPSVRPLNCWAIHRTFEKKSKLNQRIAVRPGEKRCLTVPGGHPIPEFRIAPANKSLSLFCKSTG